jgi:hypothetical protein
MVFLIAFAAAVVFSLPAVLGRQDMALCCAQNCFGALLACLLGVLPVVIAYRRGGLLTAGMGCALPLLGVFMGGTIGAIVQIGFRSSMRSSFARWPAGCTRKQSPRWSARVSRSMASHARPSPRRC